MNEICHELIKKSFKSFFSSLTWQLKNDRFSYCIFRYTDTSICTYVIMIAFTKYRSNHTEVFHQKTVLKIFTELTKKVNVSEYLFNRVAAGSTAALLERYSETGVFHWILQTFSESCFYWTPPNDCF